MAKNDDKKLLTRIRERYKVMADADQRNRRLAMDDMKFVNEPGAQWDAAMKKERGDRPCYEFNKLRVTCKRIINDMRANRPAGKVRGVENSDKETAEINEGLIRNIWNRSDGDTVIDQAAEYQVSGGMGAWRIATKYASDDVFEQEIFVEAISNPFCLYADPAAKDQLKRDARDWILTDRISRAAYQTRWPGREVISFDEDQFDDEEEWSDEETVRIVEYWWKETYDKTLLQLIDGKVIDGASDEAALIPPEAVRQVRTVKANRVKMCIASGDAILEGPNDWAGSLFPFVLVYGEQMIVDGKHLWWGLPRFAKDAQRSYNISRTAIAETIAMTPQAKFWATVEQAKGNTDRWAEAHSKNFPFLLYNADPKAPGPPARMGGAEVPVALIQESQIASEEIKAVTGIYDASLGARSNETTGVAIKARQQQGEIATFNYMDNLSKGIRLTWEILLDLIPHIYDTERELRVIGSDGAEDYVRINQLVQDPATGQMVKVHDLAAGKYDVTVTVGPSWATKRQEAAEIYMQLTQGNPALFGVAGDLVMKSMDLPYSEEIGERLKVMLPPPIQQMMNQGKDIPPEAQAVMAQAAQAMQMVEAQMQQVQAAAAQIQQEQTAVDKGKSEIDTKMANLRAEEAKFQAEIAKQMAALTAKDAQLTTHEANIRVAEAGAEKAEQGSEFAAGIQAIQQAQQEFMQVAAAVLQQMQAQSQQQTEIHQKLADRMEARPKVRQLVGRWQGDELVAEPIYEDPPPKEEVPEQVRDLTQGAQVMREVVQDFAATARAVIDALVTLRPQPKEQAAAEAASAIVKALEIARPKVLRIETQRVNGHMVAVPVYEDSATQ